MTHEEKLTWMAKYAMKHGASILLEGECGICRECVGLSIGGTYPDYEWYEWDAEEYNRIDSNGKVWKPKDAYHKHPCVAVLGRGKEAEAQLYDWLKWFDDNNFTIEIIPNENMNKLDKIELMMGRAYHKRMIKQN